MTHKGPGLVTEVYNQETLNILHGTHAIGHNRYSTSGGTSVQHIQPIVVCNSQLAVVHNGNIAITTRLESFLRKNNVDYSHLNDTGMIGEALGIFLRMGKTVEESVIEIFPLLYGSFSMIIMDKYGITAVRDKYRIRPFVLGKISNGNYAVASESCALDAIEAKFLKEILPGEMIHIDSKGLRATQIEESNQKLDIFEFIYFARSDSKILGRSIYEVRKNLGKQLALEYKDKLDIDIIVPIPESSIPAAVGFANESKISLEYGLQRNRYIQRTFIMPHQEFREISLKQKLNAIPDVVKGKKVLLIDDSIVRGTTSRKIIDIVRSAGASEVHMLVSSSPVLYPDFYGMDIPSQKDLIAAHMSLAEIREFIGADSLGYLSYEGMIEAIGLPEESLCTACFTGNYPIDVSEIFKNSLQNTIKETV